MRPALIIFLLFTGVALSAWGAYGYSKARVQLRRYNAETVQMQALGFDADNETKQDIRNRMTWGAVKVVAGFFCFFLIIRNKTKPTGQRSTNYKS